MISEQEGFGTILRSKYKQLCVIELSTTQSDMNLSFDWDFIAHQCDHNGNILRTVAKLARDGKHFEASWVSRHKMKCHLLQKKREREKRKEWLRDGGRVSNVPIITAIWRTVLVHPPFSRSLARERTHPCTPAPSPPHFIPPANPPRPEDYINHLCRSCGASCWDLQSEPREKTPIDWIFYLLSSSTSSFLEVSLFIL